MLMAKRAARGADSGSPPSSALPSTPPAPAPAPAVSHKRDREERDAPEADSEEAGQQHADALPASAEAEDGQLPPDEREREEHSRAEAQGERRHSRGGDGGGSDSRDEADDRDQARKKQRVSDQGGSRVTSGSSSTHRGHAHSSASSSSSSSSRPTSTRTLAPTDLVDVRLLIDAAYVGAVIGKGGCHINRVRSSGATATIIKNDAFPQAEQRVLLLRGPIMHVNSAARVVLDILDAEIFRPRMLADGQDPSPGVPTSLTLLVHKQSTGSIIGSGGSIIKESQAMTGARISIGSECLGQSTDKTVHISGTTDKQVHAAFVRVVTQLAANPLKPDTKSTPFVPGTAPVNLPSNSSSSSAHASNAAGAAKTLMGAPMLMHPAYAMPMHPYHAQAQMAAPPAGVAPPPGQGMAMLGASPDFQNGAMQGGMLPMPQTGADGAQQQQQQQGQQQQQQQQQYHQQLQHAQQQQQGGTPQQPAPDQSGVPTPYGHPVPNAFAGFPGAVPQAAPAAQGYGAYPAAPMMPGYPYPPPFPGMQPQFDPYTGQPLTPQAVAQVAAQSQAAPVAPAYPRPPRDRLNDPLCSTQRIAIPAVCSGVVLGHGGSIIRELCKKSGAKISLAAPDPETPTERVVSIIGRPEEIQAAIHLIQQQVESYTPGSRPPPPTASY